MAVLAGVIWLLLFAAAQAQEDPSHVVVRKKLADRESPVADSVQSGKGAPVVRRKLEKPAPESPGVDRETEKPGPKAKDVGRAHPGTKTTPGRPVRETSKDLYVVRKGDTIMGVLRQQMKVPKGEESRWIAALKELNPGLRDSDRLIPGQKLKLPDVKKKESTEAARQAPAGKEKPLFRAGERDLEIISTVVRQAGGTVLRSGRYFITLSEKEELAVDCAAVPVVELADGSRILLDSLHRIPASHAVAILSRRSDVTVIGEGGIEGVFSVLEKIFAASKDYVFRRSEGFLEMGSVPALRLRVDWVLEQKSGGGEPRLLCGLCRLTPPSQPIPAPVLHFAGRSGLTLILVDESDTGIFGTEEMQDYDDIPALDTSGHKVLLRSLLDKLGYAYVADQSIKLNEGNREGDTLALRTDFVVNTGQRRVVIHIGELPVQFQAKLREKGMSLVQVSAGDSAMTVIENVLKGLGARYAAEVDQFRPYDDGTAPRWIIMMGALRINSSKGVVYLVPPDADKGLCDFVKKNWSRQCLRSSH